MAADIDEAIRNSWQRMRRLEYLTRRQVSLYEDISDLEASLNDLEHRLIAEERDVSKLEGVTFTGLLAVLAGEKDARLRRERAEATAARLRVRGHRGRLEQARSRLRDVHEEIKPLLDARQEYEAALDRKHAAADPAGWDELADLGRRLASVEADWWEHEEARISGVAARHALDELLQALFQASSTANLELSDKSFAVLVEQGPFGRADGAAWQAQRALEEFRRQLEDVGIQMTVELPPVDVRWFADLFFDDVITDALRYDRIRQTGAHVHQVNRWLDGMVEQLTAECRDLAGKCAFVRRQWEAQLQR